MEETETLANFTDEQIQAAKDNLVQYGFLKPSDPVRQVLRSADWNDIRYRTVSFPKNYNLPSIGFMNELAYCLRSDWQRPEPEKEPRYVVCDLVQKYGTYVVNSCYKRIDDEPLESVLLDTHFQFAGVQFEGQRSAQWWMLTNMFIASDGNMLIADGGNNGCKPATPIKARFLVKKEK